MGPAACGCFGTQPAKFPGGHPRRRFRSRQHAVGSKKEAVTSDLPVLERPAYRVSGIGELKLRRIPCLVPYNVPRH